MTSQFVAELLKIPPVTRFLCAAQLAVSLPVMLKLVSPFRVLLLWNSVTKNLEIWRIFTNFFLGGAGINFIFDFVMLYRNSDSLESLNYPCYSTDYAWQIIVAAGAILTLSYPLGTIVHFRPLLIALTYLSSSLAPPGTQSSVFGLITIPVIYYPYLMVAMDFVMGGPGAAAAGVVGLVVGHGWWWGIYGGLGGRGSLERWGKAPGWVKLLVRDRPEARMAPGVHVTAPRGRQAGGSATATGYQWGSGQRLGGS